MGTILDREDLESIGMMRFDLVSEISGESLKRDLRE